MATVYCSKVMEKLVGSSLKDEVPEGVEAFGHWFAHVKFFRARKCLFLIHVPTYYVVAVADIKKRDALELKSNFHQLLEKNWVSNKIINQFQVAQVQGIIGEVVYAKSINDRMTIGTLNNRIRDFEVLMDWHELSFEAKDMERVNHLLNDSIYKGRTEKQSVYIKPHEEMQKAIASLLEG